MTHRHPAGPFTVRVKTRSKGPRLFLADRGQIYTSRHRSPLAAARRLAEIIAGRSKLAVDIRKCIPLHCVVHYEIEAGDGVSLEL